MTAARHELRADFRPWESVSKFRPQLPPVRPRPRFEERLGLVALPSAVTAAQLFVASTLCRWGARFVEPELVRVATNLVALAVEETGPGTSDRFADQHLNPIAVSLAGYDRHILFEVVHVHTAGAASAVHGDLAVVNALSRAWGAYPTTSARVVWAELDLRDRRAVRLPARGQVLPAACLRDPNRSRG